MLLKELTAFQLSAIFDSSSAQTEIVEENLCLVMQDSITSIWVDLKKSLLKFSSYISAKNFSPTEIQEIVSDLNNNVHKLNVSHDEFLNPDGSTDLILSADQYLDPSEHFNPSYIRYLHQYFEELVTKAALTYRERVIQKNYKYKQLELGI